jgi:hypothetical protein
VLHASQQAHLGLQPLRQQPPPLLLLQAPQLLVSLLRQGLGLWQLLPLGRLLHRQTPQQLPAQASCPHHC